MFNANRNLVGSSPFLDPPVDPPPMAMLGSSDGDEVFRTLPLLAELARTPEWVASHPLAGFDVHLLLHLFDNLVGFCLAAKKLGLNLAHVTVYSKPDGYRYINRAGVIAMLRSLGVTVRPASDINLDLVRKLDQQADESGCQILIVEDGGYFSPIFALHPNLGRHLVGIVEQTSRGERLLRETGRPAAFPVLSVPSSELKKKLEPDFVADGAVRAVQAMIPNRSLRNLKSAVLGLGDMGRALVIRLAENCSPPAMFDPQPDKQLLAIKLCGRLCTTTIEAIKDADVIFGVTGHSSVTADHVPHLKHGVVLVSVSSNDTEFDKLGLTRMAGTPTPVYRDGALHTEANRIGLRYTVPPIGKSITLLADGFPVNFWGSYDGMAYGGMGNDLADLIMSILFVSTIEIALGTHKDTPGIVPGAVDEHIRRHDLCARFLRYHR